MRGGDVGVEVRGYCPFSNNSLDFIVNLASVY